VQRFHLPLETLHAIDHVVKRLERLIRVLLGKGVIGGRLERRENLLVLPLDMSLHGLEVLPGKLVRKTKERLVLQVRLSAPATSSQLERRPLDGPTASDFHGSASLL